MLTSIFSINTIEVPFIPEGSLSRRRRCHKATVEGNFYFEVLAQLLPIVSNIRHNHGKIKFF
jgi:hypothetical protein